MFHIAINIEEKDFRPALNLLKSYGGRSFRAQKDIISATFEEGRVCWFIKEDFPEARIGVSCYHGIAMGLSGIAKKGEILVDQDTISSLMESLEFTSLGLMDVEGMKAQLMVYRAETLMHSFDIERSEPMKFPYIERETETNVLNQALSETNFIQVIGRDGIGKTSFLRSFAKTTDREVHFIPIWNYPSSMPFASVETLVKSVVGIKPNTPIAEAQELLDERLKELNVRDFVSSYYSFLEFLAIGEEETLISKLNLIKRYELLENAIVELIVEANAQNKLLIIFDDLQFADGSSLDMLKQIFADLIDTDVWVIYSSEYPIDLEQKTRNVELGLLNPSVQNELIDRYGVEGIEPGPALPLQLKLYLTLVDAERDHALYQEFQGKSGIQSTPFKETDWLIERWLDHLSDQAKEVIMSAAVIGVEFSDAELKSILPSKKIEQAISELTDLGFISVDSNYQFHHRLIREKIYEESPNKVKIHNQLGDYYQQIDDPVRTVFHLISGEKQEKAIKSYLDAAQVALEKNAWRTAIDYYFEAKDLIKNLIEAEKDVDLEIVVSINEKIGDIYRDLGDEDTALKFYKSVLDSYRDILKE